MLTISTVIDGVTYVLVPNTDCAKCAFYGHNEICSMKKIHSGLKLNGHILCHMFKGAWKKKAEVK